MHDGERMSGATLSQQRVSEQGGEAELFGAGQVEIQALLQVGHSLLGDESAAVFGESFEKIRCDE